MSRVILEKVAAYVGAQTGVATKYMRWTDADVNNMTPFILYRGNGEGDSDPIKQEYDVWIILVQTPETVTNGDDRMAAIAKKLRDSATSMPSGIVRIDPIGGVRGPDYMENGRPVWELLVRVQAEGF